MAEPKAWMPFRLLLVGAVAVCPLATQAPRWTMTGRVVAAEDGKPIAGCTVTADGFQATGYPLAWSWLDWRNPEPVITGADSRFSFAIPPQPSRGMSDGYPSRLHLIIHAPGRARVFGNRYLSTFFDDPAQDLGDFALPRAASLRLRIVDLNGGPQEGVQLHIKPTAKPIHSASWFGFRRGHQSESRADGTVEVIALPAGSYEVIPTNREFPSEAQQIKIPDASPPQLPPISIVVNPPDPSDTAAGRVLDADGNAVEGYVLTDFKQYV